jgi:small subunit ribosomal protein S16
MVKLRLKRMGAINKPFYRIVVVDSRKKRDGKYLESVGYYDPKTDPLTLKVDIDKCIKWFKVGAQPSDTVKSLLKKAGVIEKWHNIRMGIQEETKIEELVEETPEAVTEIKAEETEPVVEVKKAPKKKAPAKKAKKTDSKVEVVEEKATQETEEAPTKKAKKTDSKVEVVEEKATHETEEAPTKKAKKTDSKVEVVEEKATHETEETPAEEVVAETPDTDSETDKKSE